MNGDFGYSRNGNCFFPKKEVCSYKANREWEVLDDGVRQMPAEWGYSPWQHGSKEYLYGLETINSDYSIQPQEGLRSTFMV